MTILACALRLIDNHRYDEATMANVAKSAGIAKGTLYLYFPTKESLFLELLGDRLNAWFEELEREVELAVNSTDTLDVPELLARSLAKRQAMCRLLGILHSTLERNVDEEVVHAFKLHLARQMSRGSRSLGRFLPGLNADEVQRLLLRTHALTVGLVQMATAKPSVLASYESDERLAPFKVDFEVELCGALRQWLAGWTTRVAN